MRSEQYACTREDFLDALHGRRVPKALGWELTHLCIIRGIRYHLGFAEELRGTNDAFTRALNARNIMSNVIPELHRPEDVPYCIWHPDIASEETYRELANRYPQMKYQVGRACAVAGYTGLFLELNLLPDVHIAEEARDCGSDTIFVAIMSSPVKYRVMDDYSRTVNVKNPAKGALNCDTVVRSQLVVRQAFTLPRANSHHVHKGYRTPRYDITEDAGVDEESVPAPQAKEDAEWLLYMPLPEDLPAIDKDKLILLAAYYGNVDRYLRLRRPFMISGEEECIIRGIYHNSMFAKWWSLQESDSDRWDQRMGRAVVARFIMSNDLTRLKKLTWKDKLPYIIWYPSIAQKETYRELLAEGTTPDVGMMAEAKASHNPYYADFFEKQLVSIGWDKPAPLSRGTWEEWKLLSRADNLEQTSNRINPALDGAFGTSVLAGCTEACLGIYDGVWADASQMELFAMAPKELGPATDGVLLDYDEWPPREITRPDEKGATNKKHGRALQQGHT